MANNDTGKTRGATFNKQQRLIALHKARLKLLSSIQAQCPLARLKGFLRAHFQVTPFDLQEESTELFTFPIVAVSSLPNVDFQTRLGCMSFLTVKRDGKKFGRCKDS